MRCSDFDFELPPGLIAQTPLPVRSESRLLHLAAGQPRPADRRMRDLPSLLRPGDLLVFNNTRVIPARLRGNKPSGGQIEVLIERILDDRRVLAQVRGGRSLRPGMTLQFDDGVGARAVGRTGEFHELEFMAGCESSASVPDILQRIGNIPLPPYIERAADAGDRDRYQTIFAERDGAVAAPTAGLHFDDDLVAQVQASGAGIAGITLHVGAGTFQPVRSEEVSEHRMHREWFEVDAAVCEQVRATQAAGGRVIAIGTTVVRALESAAKSGELEPFAGDTDIFITPGYRFRVVDALVTNFHLPRSTLLMLVCAFAGTGPVLAAYRHAVAQRYRFFSYGDAMFLS